MRSFTAGNPLEDGEVFILDPALIEAGDIVLTAEPELTSRVIRILSAGAHSHAAICTRPTLLMEANIDDLSDPGQVRRVSVFRITAAERKAIRVLRLNPDVANRQFLIDKAAALAEEKISGEYWLERVKAFFWPTLMPNELEKFFCSHLIADAYKEAGIELLPGREPEAVAPGDFVESPYLRDVTDTVIKIETESVVRASLAAGKGPHQEIELPTYQRLLKDKDVAAIFKGRNEPVPTKFHVLLQSLEQTRDKALDEIIAPAIVEMAGKYMDYLTSHALTEAQNRALAAELAAGSLPREKIEAEHRYWRNVLFAFDEDISDREQDLKDITDQFTRSKQLATFYRNFQFGVKYRDFMIEQRTLIGRRVAMLKSHLP